MIDRTDVGALRIKRNAPPFVTKTRMNAGFTARLIMARLVLRIDIVCWRIVAFFPLIVANTVVVTRGVIGWGAGIIC